MASSGAGVMAARSVEVARTHGVPLNVRSSFDDDDGTWIREEDETMLEKALISAVVHQREETVYRVDGVSPARLFAALAEAGVNVDTIVQTSAEIVFSAPVDDGRDAARALDSLDASWSARDDLGKVSLIGAGMKSHPGVAAQTFATLERSGIEPEVVCTSPIKIACHVARADVDRAVAGAPRGVRACLAPSASASSARRARSARSRSSCSPRAGTRTCARSPPRPPPAGRCRTTDPTCRSRRRPRKRSRAASSTCASSPSARRSAASSSRTRARAARVCIDKSSAYRLVDGVPLVVPEVNGGRALEHDGILANPNCCAIPLSLALKPLHDAAGVARVRVATYQSVSGAGTRRMDELRSEGVDAHNVVMDWTFEGYGDETEEESKLREETRKILELPELPVSATCVRVPVLVGHCEAVWVELEEPLSAEQATAVLGAAPSLRLVDLPTPKDAAGADDVLVGRIRPDRSSEHGLAFFLAGDNLRKGAALNAIQIAELVLSHATVAA